jgi:hypothetical protein
LFALAWPPSHQPARQFDQIVGRFEARPKTRKVRNRGIAPKLVAGNRERFNLSKSRPRPPSRPRNRFEKNKDEDEDENEND